MNDVAEARSFLSRIRALDTRFTVISLYLALMSCGATSPPHPMSDSASQPTNTRDPTPAKATPTFAIERTFPNISLHRMVHLTYPDDSTDRLFLTLQPGRIMVFGNRNEPKPPKTFLDIRKRVSDQGNEEGLLSLAFHPQYRSNGYFYTYYSASSPRRSVLSRFSVSPDDLDRADPNSESIVLEITQPYSNHNGGQIVFGPDGYLYLGLGDGGKGGDPHGNGQNTSTLLGSIIRIAVKNESLGAGYSIPADNPFVGRGVDFREEIWAYGLRNPWRFTFDAQTDKMWAADVGQRRHEEVDIITAGKNYGWNRMEGSECFRSRACSTKDLEPPIAEYGRSDGCSITGGYVYRGSRLPTLHGAYIYGDFCSGKIWALWLQNDHVIENRLLIDSDLTISSFGEDRNHELYILSFTGGIYRLVRR